MKAATLVKGELIGLNVKVVKSTNPENVGMSGRVIDETQNTIVLRQNETDKIVIKETAIFRFTLPNGTIVEVEGSTLLGRPEDRVKKKLKGRW